MYAASANLWRVATSLTHISDALMGVLEDSEEFSSRWSKDKDGWQKLQGYNVMVKLNRFVVYSLQKEGELKKIP